MNNMRELKPDEIMQEGDVIKYGEEYERAVYGLAGSRVDYLWSHEDGTRVYRHRKGIKKWFLSLFK